MVTNRSGTNGPYWSVSFHNGIDTLCRSGTTEYGFQEGSVTASSTSRIGMSSRIGYARRHSPHFNVCPSFFSARGFLQTGQTSMSSKSWGIMGQILRLKRLAVSFQPFSGLASQIIGWRLSLGKSSPPAVILYHFGCEGFGARRILTGAEG